MGAHVHTCTSALMIKHGWSDNELCECLLTHCGPVPLYWWHISGSILVQAEAHCLTAPSHYLNHCWLIISSIIYSLCNSTANETTSNFASIHYLIGLVIPFDDVKLDRCWFRQRLVACRHQDITWTNVDVSFVVFCRVSLWAFVQHSTAHENGNHNMFHHYIRDRGMYRVNESDLSFE